MKTTKICIAAVVSMTFAAAALAAADYESPPVLKAADLAPRDVPLKGERYRVDDAVPTDGFLAAFTLRTDFGTMQARGPGMLRMRVAEVAALAELEKMESSKVFADALKRSASSFGGAVANVVTNTAEVAQAVPASVGRFFERVGRQAKTAAQNLGDIKDEKDAGAPRGAESSTNKQNLAVAGGVAGGRAVRDILGYDEQRRHLAKTLGVDPYSTNLILRKKLDDIAWAAFAGGLGVDILSSKIPGGRIIKSTSVLSDWIYEKPPGDLKVWIEKSLKEMGVDKETIDLFLRQKYWTLTTQTTLVMALEKLDGIEGRAEVLDTAVTAENEDQARFLAVGLALLAREHAKTPFKAIISGKPIGMTKKGCVVVTMPLDYLSWVERVAKFSGREDLVRCRPSVLITGRFSTRAQSEMKKAGWEVREGVPLAGAF